MQWLRRLVRNHYWRQDSLIYEVTPRCNLRCGHCYNIWKTPAGGEPGELPTAKALRLIDKACRDARSIRLTFSGGEPCLRDDLEVLVRRAKKRNQDVNLISNGVLLDENRVASLVDAGVGLFELPLNSADRRMHDGMSGVEGSFDNVVKAALAIARTGATLVFVFVGTKNNIDGWRRALELGYALGGRSFLFNRYNAGGVHAGSPEALLPTLDQLRGALAVAEAYAAEYQVGIGASIAIQPCLVDTARYPHIGFGWCAAGTASAYYTLDPLGNVRPCNHSQLVLGNIFATRLSTMAKGEEMRRFMTAKPMVCSPCRLADTCQGGCKAAAEQCYGDACLPEPFLAVNAEQMRPCLD